MMLIKICPVHTKYGGAGKPTSSCENCWAIWACNHPEAIGVTLAELHAKSLNTDVQTLPLARAKHGRTVR